MARISRIVVPGYPHHVTQRGVRSMDVFDSDEDRYAYIGFLSDEAKRFGLDILAWRPKQDVRRETIYFLLWLQA